jgi:predicted transcriptional regulator
VKQPEYIQMQIRLSAPIRKRLEREAQRRMVSKNYIINQAVEAFLNSEQDADQLVTSA